MWNRGDGECHRPGDKCLQVLCGQYVSRVTHVPTVRDPAFKPAGSLPGDRASLVPNTHTHTHIHNTHKLSWFFPQGYLRTLRALWPNEQMLQRQTSRPCVMSGSALSSLHVLSHLTLPVTVIISVIKLMTVIISWDRRLSQAIQVVKGRDSISVALTQNLSQEPTFSLPVGRQTDEGLHSGWVGLPLLQGLAHGHLGLHKKVLINRLSLQAETNFHERQFVGPK